MDGASLPPGRSLPLVLAVIPAAAQAERKHWFQNAVKATEGEEIPIVERQA
jgi:hypothetical protein